MTNLPDYHLTAVIPKESEAWSDLASLLPKGGDLLGATLEISPTRASVDLVYRGRRTDSTPHKRKSSLYVSLGDDESAEAWIYRMFYRTHGFRVYDTFVRMLPAKLGAASNVPQEVRDSIKGS